MKMFGSLQTDEYVLEKDWESTRYMGICQLGSAEECLEADALDLYPRNGPSDA